ncbi:MAG: carboxypeptidase regulatory-like domain-containing protein, partial [Blastocatellia bacterium]
MAILCLILAPLTFAQSTLTLRGQISDEQAAVIPGARITLTGANATPRETLTGVNGDFSITGLAQGKYTLVVEAPGFQPHTQTELEISADTKPLQVRLAVAQISMQEEVPANATGASVEPDENLSAIILEGDELQDLLPDNQEEMLEFLQTLAGPAAGGAGGRPGAQIMINGFRGGRIPPKEAIQQVRINSNPYSAEFSQSGFARIEIITRPGNDHWRGSGSYSARNAVLDARNAFALTRPDLSQNRYSFSLSGPLIKKRLSFFVNYDKRDLAGGSTITATTLSGPFIANVPSPNHNWSFDTRADYGINKNNTLNMTYEYARREALNREFGGRASAFILPERGSRSRGGNQTLRLAETMIINTRLIMESRMQYDRAVSDVTGNTNGVAINVIDAFNGGGAVCCPASNQTWGMDWQQYLIYTKKRHTAKLGWQQEYDHYNDFSATNFNGTFTFASLSQYRLALDGQARAQQFTINRGNPRLRYGMWRAAWFANDDWRISPKVTLSFGLRHEFQQHLGDRNNFAPRIGLAWSPFRDRKTTFRFGGGLFYQRLANTQYENTLRYNGVTQQAIVISNAQYPDPFAGNPVIQVRNTTRRTLDADLRAPYNIMFSTSIERQWARGLSSAMTYIFSRGVHQFRARNINAPRPDTYDPRNPAAAEFPFGPVGAINQTETTARSTNNSLQFRGDRRLGRRFSVFGSYTLSWTNSDADGGAPANSYDLRAEWARSLSDRRHQLTVGGRVTLPWDISLTPYATWLSGLPFNITTGFDDNGDTSFTDRPAGLTRNTDLPVSLYGSLTNRCVQNCAAGQTPLLLRDFLTRTFPNGLRAEGPGAINVTLRMSKSFSFGEPVSRAQRARASGGGGESGQGSVRRDIKATRQAGKADAATAKATPTRESGRFSLQFSAQATNVLNHVNFGPYSGVLSSPYFGRAATAGPARQIELSVRFG